MGVFEMPAFAKVSHELGLPRHGACAAWRHPTEFGSGFT
jgi:hypothetical protein